MIHFVAHTVHGAFAFTTWEEGIELFDKLCALPGIIAVVVMPDHVHVLVARDCWWEFVVALRSYARWFHHRHGQRGRLWRPIPLGQPIAAGPKRRRTLRYVYLNPSRARLEADPLSWPLSTYRDALGIRVGTPRCRPDPDPYRLHSYTSSDPTCRVEGTELPIENLAEPDLITVAHAVSALTRTPLTRLRQRGPARSLFLRAARCLTTADLTQIAKLAGVQPRQLKRVSTRRDVDVAMVARVCFDIRFHGLDDTFLPATAAWRRYR